MSNKYLEKIAEKAEKEGKVGALIGAAAALSAVVQEIKNRQS